MISKKTRVLFIPAWYPSACNHILGIFVKQHAMALNGSVTLAVLHVCPNKNLKGITEFEKTFEDGILVYRNYFFQFSLKLLRPLNWITYFFALVSGYHKTIKDFGEPHLNHVHVLTRTGVIGLIANLIYNTPYCISEHWSRYLPERNSYKGLIRKALTSFIVKRSKGLSAVATSLKKAMQKHSIDHRNFAVIPNTVDFDFFTSSSSKVNGSDFRFLHVSGLTDSTKNVSGIIKALQMLKIEGLEVTLNLVGDCHQKQDLKDLVRDLNLEDSVYFSGELRGNELVKAYQEAQAFVLFSFFENQPCVLLEAFAVGIPVVATDVGGISEIVNSENGMLTAPGDYRLLAEKMKGMMKRIDMYDSEKIRAHAHERFGYSSVKEQFIEFYNRCLENQTKR